MLNKTDESCEICGKASNDVVLCCLCGAQVCTECALVQDRICLACDEAKCYICNEYLASRACNICGQLVCEDHGTKKDESTTCDNCRMRES
ncbi:hypothetical protein EU527_09790 [Candidatus Thorarchaeota archaeon]|nr:MAG: hypothetical protein EU527_09790 [Candidatus Thorarchaeota archaeon]